MFGSEPKRGIWMKRRRRVENENPRSKNDLACALVVSRPFGTGGVLLFKPGTKVTGLVSDVPSGRRQRT